MAIPSSRSSGFSQSRSQEYGWRIFILEFFHGLLTVAWYLVALVEMSMLMGLNRLGRLAALSRDDVSKVDQSHDVLMEPASSFEDSQG